MPISILSSVNNFKKNKVKIIGVTSPIVINSITYNSINTSYPATSSDVYGTAITNNVTYNVYAFTQDPSKNVNYYTVNYNCNASTICYVLLVGGGGGGGSYAGSSGGGGGVIMMPINVPIGIGSIKVIVGTGGLGAPINSYTRNNGSNSSIIFSVTSGSLPTISTYTALGGGYGASGGGSTNGGIYDGNGGNGACGGGAGTYQSGVGTLGISNNTGYVFGNNGTISANGGQGGGAGGVSNGSTGGSGIICLLPGINSFNSFGSYYWGGGGGAFNATGGIGGGGGSSSQNGSNPKAGGGSAINSGGSGTSTNGGSGGSGGTNSGGGGGSAWNGSGGNGGSGIVVIAFPNTITTFLLSNNNFSSPIISSNSSSTVVTAPTVLSGLTGWTIGGTGNYYVMNGNGGTTWNTSGYYACPYLQFFYTSTTTNTTISQSISLNAQTYTIAFCAATNSSYTSGQFLITVGGTLIYTSTLSSLSTSWNVYSQNFTISTAGIKNIVFSFSCSVGISNILIF